MPGIMKQVEKFAARILPESFIKDTNKKLIATNVAFTGTEYCGISIIASIIIGVGIFVTSLFIPFPYLPAPIYSVIGFAFSFLILTLMLPYIFIERRVGELEEVLPDALRQMSTTLKAGVSMDAALEDVADSDYGALSEEFQRTIVQVHRGRPMRSALTAMARRTKSDLFQRAFYLIVEGMEKGAELADVLEAVSDDIRETHTIQRERRSSTMQQVMFLLAAALFAAPFITGLVLSLGNVFSEIGTGMTGGAGTTIPTQVLPPGTKIVIPLFIAIESAITAMAVGVIRYGEVVKGLMYIAPFVGAALAVFFGAQFASGFLF